MNQYICRVCKGNECTVLTSQGPPNCGCLHNSDIGALWEQDSSYQSEREKVLDRAEQLEKDMKAAFSRKTGEYNPTSIMLVQQYVKELRQTLIRDDN